MRSSAATKAPKTSTPRATKRVTGSANLKEKGSRGSNWSEDDSILLAQACGFAKSTGQSKRHLSPPILIVEGEGGTAKDHRMVVHFNEFLTPSQERSSKSCVSRWNEITLTHKF